MLRIAARVVVIIPGHNRARGPRTRSSRLVLYRPHPAQGPNSGDALSCGGDLAGWKLDAESSEMRRDERACLHQTERRGQSVCMGSIIHGIIVSLIKQVPAIFQGR
jgi:hypothetical protein